MRDRVDRAPHRKSNTSWLVRRIRLLAFRGGRTRERSHRLGSRRPSNDTANQRWGEAPPAAPGGSGSDCVRSARPYRRVGVVIAPRDGFSGCFAGTNTAEDRLPRRERRLQPRRTHRRHLYGSFRTRSPRHPAPEQSLRRRPRRPTGQRRPVRASAVCQRYWRSAANARGSEAPDAFVRLQRRGLAGDRGRVCLPSRRERPNELGRRQILMCFAIVEDEHGQDIARATPLDRELSVTLRRVACLARAVTEQPVLMIIAATVVPKGLQEVGADSTLRRYRRPEPANRASAHAFMEFGRIQRRTQVCDLHEPNSASRQRLGVQRRTPARATRRRVIVRCNAMLRGILALDSGKYLPYRAPV